LIFAVVSDKIRKFFYTHSAAKVNAVSCSHILENRCFRKLS